MSLKEIKRHFLLWIQFAKASGISELEYRANFFLRIITDIFWYATQLASFEVILAHIGQLSGWQAPQVRVFLAILFLVDAIFMTLFHANLDNLSQKVIKGQLDLVLAKPIDSQFTMSVEKVSLSYMINFFMVAAFLFWSLLSLPQISLWQCLNLLWLIPGGVIISYSLRFMILSLVVAFVGAESIMYIWWSIYRLGMRPDSIYTPWMRYIVMSLVPVAFIASVPARLILNEWDFGLGLLAFLMPILTLWISRRVWGWALRNYASASS